MVLNLKVLKIFLEHEGLSEVISDKSNSLVFNNRKNSIT